MWLGSVFGRWYQEGREKNSGFACINERNGIVLIVLMVLGTSGVHMELPIPFGVLVLQNLPSL